MDKLRQQYAGSTRAFDADGDGTVSGAELLSLGDTDGDGKLDAGELQKVAERFTEQLKYSNQLLEQIQSFEEQALAAQKEIQAKQQALRSALRVCDLAKEEASEFKRKLAVQTEVAANMSEQCKEARLDASSRKRECDGLRRAADTAKSEAAQLREERDALAAQADELRQRNSELQTASNNDRSAASGSLATAAAEKDSLREQLADLRQRNGPLVEQVKGLQESFSKVKEALAAEEAGARRTAEQRDGAERRAASLEAELGELRSGLSSKDDALSSKAARAEELESGLQAQRDLYTAKAAQLRAAEEREAAVQASLRGLTDEHASLKEELEQLGNELLSGAQARMVDQERWEKKLAELSDELSATLRTGQEKEASHAGELQRKAQEQVSARKAHEEQYVGLQTEHTELHRLVTKMQLDANRSLEHFEGERAEAERESSDLREQLSRAENEHLDHASRSGSTASQLNAKVAELQRTLAARGEEHYEVLTLLKDAVEQLKGEAQEQVHKSATMQAEYHKLKARLASVAAETGAPLEAWHREVGNALTALVGQCATFKAREKDGRDTLRQTTAKFEEERAKKIMLEETVSDLEHQVRN